MNASTGGPIIKFGFIEPLEYQRFTELLHAELTEVPTGNKVPCWAVGPRNGHRYRGQAWRDEEGNFSGGNEILANGAEAKDTAGFCHGLQQCALVPKPLLMQNMQYRVDALMGMTGEPDLG